MTSLGVSRRRRAERVKSRRGRRRQDGLVTSRRRTAGHGRLRCARLRKAWQGGRGPASLVMAAHGMAWLGSAGTAGQARLCMASHGVPGRSSSRLSAAWLGSQRTSACVTSSRCEVWHGRSSFIPSRDRSDP